MIASLLTSLAVVGLLAAAPRTIDPSTVHPPITSSTSTTDTHVVEVPATITDDCSTDVTLALNAWVSAVPDGSTLSLDAQGCYRLDNTLRLTDRHDLVLDGNGARLEARTTYPRYPKVTRSMIGILGGTAITIRDVTLKGTNQTSSYDSTREWYHAINMEGVDGATVDNVTATSIWGDFLHLSPDGRGQGPEPHASNVVVSGSTTNVVGRNQISCTACDHVLVENNTFANTGYQVFDVEVQSPTWHASDVTFTDNTIAGRVPLSVLVSGGIGQYVRDITFSNNTMVSNPRSCQSPIYVLDTEPEKSNFVIEGNTLRTLSAAARIYAVSELVFNDNAVQLVPGGGCQEPGTAVRVAGSEGTITGNHFAGFNRILAAGLPIPPSQIICDNRLNGASYDRPTSCTRAS